MSANEVKHLTPETVSQLLPDPNQALAVQGTLLAMRGLEGAIDLLERAVKGQIRLRPAYQPPAQRQRHWPDTGADHHAGDRSHRALRDGGHYASYCRCVGSERLSNGKRKGRGNTKNGNKYLAWAYLEAANFAVRYNAAIKRYYQRKRARAMAWLPSRPLPTSWPGPVTTSCAKVPTSTSSSAFA